MDYTDYIGNRRPGREDHSCFSLVSVRRSFVNARRAPASAAPIALPPSHQEQALPFAFLPLRMKNSGWLNACGRTSRSTPPFAAAGLETFLEKVGIAAS
jgi:hypothetical protein